MIACLLASLCLAQDADDPLKTLRGKIAKAETIRVEFDVREPGARRRLGMAIRGSLLLRGKDKFRMRVEMQEGPQSGESAEVIFDGRRTTSSGLAAANPHDVTSASVERLREMLAALPLMLTFEAVFGRSGAPLPEIADVKDGGTEKHDGLERRVLRYAIKMGGQPMGKVTVLLDPATGMPTRREVDLGVGGLALVETYTAFALGEPIPPETFVYATKGRLNAAMARQLARSVELHQRFTGLAPASLEALAARPDGLDPAVLWPEGGFVLGGRVPKDPWGRPYALEEKDGETRIVGLGADGRPGGAGDASDVAVPVPSPAGDRIAPPTERLRNHYAARISLHLVAAAARAYAEAYGEAPEDLARLPEGAEHAPEGGWLPGGSLPRDPWGEALELRAAGTTAVVQVKGGQARAVGPSSLTPDERAGLEAKARPAPTPELRAAIAALIAALAGDDPDARDRAEGQLRARAAGRPELLDAAIGRERDPETKARLERVRSSMTVPIPTWRQELGRLRAVGSPSGTTGGPQTASNERNASATLKTFASAQADFRANDRDGNKIQDFWAGDVAGLYSLTADGQMIKLIEISAALADAAPLKPGDAKGRIGKLEGVQAPKAGYYFQVLEADACVTPKEPYRQDTQGEPNLGKLFNHSRFGVCAIPADYGVTGTKTFIINEGNTIFWSDTGGEPVLEWPDDTTLKAEWHKLD